MGSRQLESRTTNLVLAGYALRRRRPDLDEKLIATN
jgi:hypothetical protein